MCIMAPDVYYIDIGVIFIMLFMEGISVGGILYIL